MLSYQHLYHAGNFADVHKHIVLTLLLQALQKKPAAFCYVETHAGRASYDFQSPEAQKNSEFLQGIAPLYSATEAPVALNDYLKIVRNQNVNATELRFYPGSPRIAQHYLREQDRMILAERHPQEAPLLKRVFHQDKRVSVHHRDGYEMLRALLPPAQARGLVLIDPAYETDSDYAEVVEALKLIQQRWRSAMIMVWYPLLKASTAQQWQHMILDSGLRDVLCCELQRTPLDGTTGMKGSGVLILQPPWQMSEQLEQLMPYLATTLQVEHIPPTWRVQQWQAE